VSSYIQDILRHKEFCAILQSCYQCFMLCQLHKCYVMYALKMTNTYSPILIGV